MRTEAGLAAAALRHRPVPWLLLALGVAVAVAFPVLAAGLRQEATAAAISTSVDSLPSYERTVLASTYRDLSTSVSDPGLDVTVQNGLLGLGAGDVTGALSFKPVAVGGVATSVVALDRLADHVRLVSGSLPARCEPTRCEILSIRQPGAIAATIESDQARRDLGLVVTGVAELTDQRLTGSGLVAADRALLLGGDRSGLGQLAKLDLFGRTLAWYGTLDGRAVAAAGVTGYADTLRDLGAQVDLVNPSPLNIQWPQDRIAAAAATAAAAGNGFVVLGAGAGALQVGFCAVVAAGARRRQLRVGELLARRGGSRAQIVVVAALQTGASVLLGSLIGLAAALLAVVIRAPGAGAEPTAAALTVLGGTWPVVGALAVVAVSLTTAILVAAAERSTGRWLLWSALGAAVLVCVLGFGVVGAARSVMLSGATVVAYVLGLGLLVTLGWPTLIRRLGPRRGSAPIHGSVVAARRPLLPMITAGFLATAVCLLSFAAGYRQSLSQLAADEAAYAVPLEVAVDPSSRVVAPLDAVDPAALAAAVPTAVVRPVVNTAVTVFGGTPRAQSRPLTGVDAATLAAMRRFAATTGANVSPAELADRLRTNVPAAPSTTIPVGTHRLSLRADGYDSATVLGLWLSTAAGRSQRVEFTGSGPDLTATVTAAEPLTVRAFEISESEQRSTGRAHATGEGKFDRPLTAGTLALSPLDLDGQPLGSWTGWGSAGAEVSALADRRLRVAYQFSQLRIVLSPDFIPVARRAPLPVAVDPATAAAAGPSARLVLTINQQRVPATVVAVLDRFPGRGSQVLLADRAAMTALLDELAPGTAFVGRLWLDAPAADLPALSTWLESSPAAAAGLSFRRGTEERLRSDPVATRSLLLLTLAGSFALALGMVAAAAGVRADQAASATDHRALELAGTPPAALRHRLWQRGWLVAVVGLPAGIVGGVVLTRFGVGLLLPETGVVPLLPDIAPALVAVVTGIAAIGVLAASAIPALAAYREDWPRPAELDLP